MIGTPQPHIGRTGIELFEYRRLTIFLCGHPGFEIPVIFRDTKGSVQPDSGRGHPVRPLLRKFQSHQRQGCAARHSTRRPFDDGIIFGNKFQREGGNNSSKPVGKFEQPGITFDQLDMRALNIRARVMR